MKKTKKLIISALFAALITVMTAYICHIPFGSSGGYFHLGDTLIYLAAVILPKPYAILASLIGAGLADFLTAPVWVIPTVIIKSLICLPFTSKGAKIISLRNIISVFICCAITIIGYYLAEGIMYGNWVAALYGTLGNVAQSSLSGALFIIVGFFIDKNDIKKRLKI